MKKLLSAVFSVAVLLGFSGIGFCGEIHEATKRGDIQLVKKLLNQGVKVDARAEDGDTPLCCAVDKGHIDVVKLLIDRGANVNVRGSGYPPCPPLVKASFGRHTDIVKLLIKNEAMVNAFCLEGVTPFIAAAQNGDFETAKVLMDNGADFTRNLDVAIRGGNSDLVKMMITRGANVNEELYIGTVMNYAVNMKNIEVIKMMINKGGRVKGSDLMCDAVTDLENKTMSNTINLIELLVENGVNINADSECGVTFEGRDMHLPALLLIAYGLKERNVKNNPIIKDITTDNALKIMKLLIKEGAVVTHNQLDDFIKMYPNKDEIYWTLYDACGM